MVKNMMDHCRLCPRKCGQNRREGAGYCGADDRVRVARAGLHFWEEPCISGTHGSGTVFFTGCPLHCVFCQNYEISCGGTGRTVSCDELAEIFLSLQEQGAHNINLVSPTQFIPQIACALDKVKGNLTIPVVYNTGGYERVSSLHMLDGLIDVYLPDIKYYDRALCARYSAAPDYFERAVRAVDEMIAQTGGIVIEHGLMKRGVLIRHLMLPGSWRDSAAVIRELGKRYTPNEVMVSLMGQYTPVPGAPKELSRKITTYEYQKVAAILQDLPFDGYFQERSASDVSYIPAFET